MQKNETRVLDERDAGPDQPHDVDQGDDGVQVGRVLFIHNLETQGKLNGKCGQLEVHSVLERKNKQNMIETRTVDVVRLKISLILRARTV